MNERDVLLRRIGALGFAMFDLHLYLNTHPADTTALALFNRYKQQFDPLVAEYERKFGPLTAANAAYGGKWQWINNPWPWEYNQEA